MHRKLVCSAVAFWTLLCGMAVVSDQAFAQFGRVPSAADGESRPDLAFVTNRGLNRALTKAKEYLEQKEYDNGVKLLQPIIENPEDFFFKASDDNKSSFRSLKAEAQRLVASMPPDGRRQYELQFGQAARNLLNDALASGAKEKLEEAARNYFHTAAGYEATYRLGTYYLDHSEPLAAVLTFRRIQSFPQVARKWEPMLSLKTAVAWGRAGMPEKSVETLIELKRATQHSQVTVGGKQIPLFGPNDDALEWLVAVLGQRREFASLEAEQWVMFRGNAARNAATSEASPVLNSKWQFSTFIREQAEDPKPFQIAAAQMQELEKVQHGKALLAVPSAHPLVIGDLAIVRSMFDVKAVDLKTGQLRWEAATIDPLFMQLLVMGSQVVTPNRANQQPVLDLFLKQRAWNDLSSGTLSSDGKRVFSLDETGFVGPFRNNPRSTQQHPLAPKSFNKLMAFDLNGGNFLWEIGGPPQGGLKLAGTFFLGPPLPLGKHLYCLAERNGEIQLLALEPITLGSLSKAKQDVKLKWSQSLILPSATIMQNPVRRLAGISPSFADGVMICPTTSGRVVAVDLSRRLLLWGYRYSDVLDYDPRNRQAMFMRARLIAMGRYPGVNTDDENRWIDSNPTIAEGRVVLTPRDSNEIHCLNLIDGSLVWKKPREQGLYVASIHDGKVIIVGRSQVAALALEDGEPIWPQSTPIPTPSGRGFRTATRYHIPLSTGEIATLDLVNGRILARSKLRDGRVPGNLAAAGGSIVSQSVDSVVAFKSLSELNEQIDSDLKKNPDDFAALALRASVRLHQGDVEQGLDDLRRSIKINANPRARAQMAATLLEGLRLDFSKYRKLTAEIDSLIEDPQQRTTYLRLYADGLQKIGERRAAFSEYLKLAGPDTSEPTMERISGNRTVRSDRWVRGRISEMYAAAPAADRLTLDREIRAQFAAAAERKQAEPLRKIIGYFASHAVANEARRDLIEQLDEKQDSLELEFQLEWLRQSEKPAEAGYATARLASLLIAVDRADEARDLVKQLSVNFSGIECLNGKTGKQLAEQWLADAKLGPVLTNRANWLAGRVDTKRVDKVNAFQRSYPVAFEGPRGKYFEDWTFELDQRRLFLSAKDGQGKVRWKLPSNNQAVPNTYGNYIRVHGHLMVVVLGNRFEVLDTLAQTNPPKVLWRGDLHERQAGKVVAGNIQIRQMNVIGGRPKITITDRMGRPFGSVGVINDEFVCYQIGAKLYAADTLTGKTLWVRDNLTHGSDMFGDHDRIIVAPPNSQDAVVLRASDGERVAVKRLPAVTSRLATVGSRVLTWVTSGNKHVLELEDVVAAETVWSQKFEGLALPAVVNGDEVAVLEAAGRIRLFAIANGKLRIDSPVEAQKDLMQMTVMRSSEHYVVLTNTPMNNQNIIRVNPLVFNNPIVNGSAYGFDRATGRKLWSTVIERQAIEMNQPKNLPVLVFVCRLYQLVKAGNRTQRYSHSILILDKRNGRVLFRDAKPPSISKVQVLSRQADQQVVVEFDRASVTLIFTDEPQPVAPQPGKPNSEKPAADSPKPDGVKTKGP